MTDAAQALSSQRERDIRERLAKITPGAWNVENEEGRLFRVISMQIVKGGWNIPEIAFCKDKREDALFIAAVPRDIADLLAEIGRLRAELSEQTRLVARYRPYAVGHALDNFIRTEEHDDDAG